MRRDLRIVFAGGGTGGHVFPAIYMAEYLSKHWGADCQFIGTKKGLENRKVSQAGFLVRHIWISGFKRGLYLSNLIFPLKLLISSVQSRKILRQIKPHLVVGTGGYVAGPAIRQAIKLNIPTAIQEQNSYPGVTTRLLAPQVDCVFLAYEEALKYLGKLKKYQIVGNPIK
ncbi:MAG: glycosyltransferase, partial [Calditrichia bacterium]|nr:glycosyltransferase [Calditrichia bacterium]